MNKYIPKNLLQKLPSFEKAIYYPAAYEDSTHDIWRLKNIEDSQEDAFLKLCQRTESPFWQVMHDLFDFDLRQEIPCFSSVYQTIKQHTSLIIPRLIDAENETTSATNNSATFILTTTVAGKVVQKSNLQMARQLAKHLAQLHRHRSETWGALNNPRFESKDWSNRLEAALVKSASRAIARQRRSTATQTRRANKMSKKWGGVFLKPNKHLETALDACSFINTSEFVPLMPDLRWDQFLQDNGKLSALVDLDAFVFAPRELDFVLLEYLLQPQQAEVFVREYEQYFEIPKIKQARQSYRLLLYFMQVLGEVDLDTWMNQKTYF